MSTITIDEQIACVRREISMRERVYPRWVESGRLTQQKADAETNAMRAVLATLEGFARTAATGAVRMNKTIRDASRGNYTTKDETPTWQEVRDGALLRIADATEKMAQRHTDLIRERDYYERAHKREADVSRRLARRITALQGVVTRMKNARAAASLTFDLVAHVQRAREFSERTFGPGARTAGVVAHIRKELAEIEAAPDDLSEWIDVVILALDGAWRAGYSAEQIVDALAAKQAKNEARTWPDWRTAPADGPIEHVRDEAQAAR